MLAPTCPVPIALESNDVTFVASPMAPPWRSTSVSHSGVTRSGSATSAGREVISTSRVGRATGEAVGGSDLAVRVERGLELRRRRCVEDDAVRPRPQLVLDARRDV